MNNVLVSTAALPDVADGIRTKYLNDKVLDLKYIKRSQILILEEVAKILQMQLISKELFEVTNSETQKTKSILSKF